MTQKENLKGIFFCQDCELAGVGESSKRGSVLITIFLLLCFLIPGIVYMIYRNHTKGTQCEHCHSKNVIPITSAKVKKVLGDGYAEFVREAIEYAKPAQRNRVLVQFFTVLLVVIVIGRCSVKDDTPPPKPAAKIESPAVSIEKPTTAKVLKSAMEFLPAPEGDAVAVATKVITDRGNSCDSVVDATRSADGRIAAICRSGSNFLRYRVFTLRTNNEDTVMALNCEVVKQQGIDGC